MGNTIETYIDFIQYQRPGLKSGDYTLEASQTITAAGVSEKNTFPSQTLNFSIRGERFALKPSDIASVYPPANSLGEHSASFPQVVLARNTLPWERMIAEPKDEKDRTLVEDMPWMALLVFNEEELDAEGAGNEKGDVMTISDFLKLPNLKLPPKGGKPPLESDENSNDKLTVVTVKKSLLQQLLPSGEDLARWCHARESSLRINLDNPGADSLYYELWDAKGQLAHAAYAAIEKREDNTFHSRLEPGKLKAGDYNVKVWIENKPVAVNPQTVKITANDEFGQKVAIVPANRLPRPGARSIVHLVSLEERYHWDGSQYSFYFDNLKDNDRIPLVSLKSWSFNCVTETHNFDQLLVQLIDHGKKDTLNTLRLPLRPNPGNDANISAANRYLESGYVPLPHFFRRGGNSVSWYRSPMIPGHKKNPALPADLLPASSSDALLLYDEQYGMFDASYAAAWELGRLMALKNKGVSTSLYRWKRLHRNQLKLAEQQELHPHLPYHQSIGEAPALPEEVENWFSAMGLLKGLPFNYLVPDERMLPKESFRFFQLDPDWISCLIDGAFTVGRVTAADAKTDQKLHQDHVAGKQPPVVSGFLLRSYVVKGWPQLQVDGYNQLAKDEAGMDNNKLKILRMERLSPNVLLCLFKGDAMAVDIHQKPEILHLGFTPPEPHHQADRYTKALRNVNGLDQQQDSNKPGKQKPYATEIMDKSDWDPQTRIVQVSHLYKDIENKKKALNISEPLTSAQFALSMVEGVQKVRFVRTGAG
ncbi:hypothetical protein [Phaeodactylibacter sp.]|uniref:hypothetical protein n=1 Tax=Phaeodactylibacter sp. TaxID=1940289 RepID=UPI0025E4E2B6|nr:hypothetical protein [Phaeodactylibacter sp.]MCI4649917.1 hypothetical protein [Phaeodactylibacter sp.]MCI5090147.1 hypothetical protein [Phaeodactylibacter sp.]